MSNVGYDLDTSGGLMPLIRALIKPPDEDGNGQKSKRPQHPYYKRPGKGHNHDSCDACGEGGDLICCDRCPASFHLGCYDPPLDENDIPAGQWLCKECRSSELDKPASSRSSRAQSPSDSKSDTSEKRTRSLRNNRTDSTQAKKKGKEDQSKDESVQEEKPAEKKEEKELTAMEILVKAARVMNPKQFDLPREMKIPCPFPGTDKEVGKTGSGVVSVDAWGAVPVPARSCFVCRGTCKPAPLLQCDYCPLLFHQDCLDPPLTALPTGRWMCPNHVEQHIDWMMVNSISATERVALWDQFSAPVDQHAVKIDFIRKARNHRPAFRQKIPVGVKGRVIVPKMVRYHYQNPPPLMPSRREYVRCRNVLKQLKASGVYSESEDETAEKKHEICLNLECPQYQGDRADCLLKGVSESAAQADLRALHAAPESDSAPAPDSESAHAPETDSGSESDSDLDQLMTPVKRRKVAATEKLSKKKDGKSEKLRLVESEETRSLLAAAQRQLQQLDSRLVTLLAWQRLHQIVAGSLAAAGGARTTVAAATRDLVTRSIDRAALAKYGFRHVALPSQLLTREDQERISARVWGSPAGAAGSAGVAGAAGPGEGEGEGESEAEGGASLPRHSLCGATLRATLSHVQRPAPNGLGDGLGAPVAMRLSRLTIGRGACDLSLRLYAHCRYVSSHHATIFYDEVTRHFELMNYSEWGTRVNGVLYACELSPAPAPAPAPALAPAPAEERGAALLDITRKRRPKPIRLKGSITVAEGAPCRCLPPRPSSPATPGDPTATPATPAAPAWEGTALLPHGALIQVGCIQFVFSIADAIHENVD